MSVSVLQAVTTMPAMTQTRIKEYLRLLRF
jgi:hypothetical protein